MTLRGLADDPVYLSLPERDRADRLDELEEAARLFGNEAVKLVDDARRQFAAARDRSIRDWFRDSW